LAKLNFILRLDVFSFYFLYRTQVNLWLSTIEKDLPKLTEHIKAAWENREKHISYMKILTRGAPSEKQFVSVN